MWMWKSLCAPAAVSVGAAVPETVIAWADAGAAISAEAAISTPIKRR
jgi:hypothetical protein